MSTRSIGPEEALAKWFPELSGFRDQQKATVDRLTHGTSTLLLMPTGLGKSLTYQLPVLMAGGVGIVISPLIALMREHAEKLNKKGIRAISLGGLNPKEAQDALRLFPWNEGPGFILTSPERAETDGFLEHLIHTHRDRVTLIAIDEAHCISQWGHDFRPPYKALPDFLNRACGRSSWPTVLCLTATLDQVSEKEVLGDFRMKQADTIRSQQMIRTNLQLEFRRFHDNDEKLVALNEVLERNRGKKIIVYAHLKQNKKTGTRALAERLCQDGHRASAFDADMSVDERDETMRAFAQGKVDIVCATGAFGMGVDIPDVRGVIHFLLPESLEQYYQEVGRAGRDGGSAFGLLLYTPKNAQVRRDMIEARRMTAEKILALWSSLFDTGGSEIRSLNPQIEFQGRDDDYALFYAFQRAGAVEILARGPGRLSSFAARSPAGVEWLNRLSSATRTGSILAAFRKLNLDPRQGYQRLFTLYEHDDIRLTKTPDNVLVFRANKLAAEQAQQMADELNAKLDARLCAFDDFRLLIETSDNPGFALKERFGVRQGEGA